MSSALQTHTHVKIILDEVVAFGVATPFTPRERALVNSIELLIEILKNGDDYDPEELTELYLAYEEATADFPVPGSLAPTL